MKACLKIKHSIQFTNLKGKLPAKRIFTMLSRCGYKNSLFLVRLKPIQKLMLINNKSLLRSHINVNRHWSIHAIDFFYIIPDRSMAFWGLEKL
jgi:hypothetical protein